MDGKYVIEMENICKSFYGVQVLRNAQINVAPGEVVALIGENGAGKSTLMNILCGIHQADSGTIRMFGEEIKVNNPHDAYLKRIAMVHQEICLVEQMSVEDNLFLGSEPKSNLLNRDKATVREKTQEALDLLDLPFAPNTPVERLNVAQQQMVEVARAIVFDAKVVIFDEPTASLSSAETEKLFEVVRAMQEKGIGIIYISHRLEEIFRICNRVTVLRDSQFIGTRYVSDITKDELVAMMVGRTIDDYFGDKKTYGSDRTVLSVRGLTGEKFHDVSFDLKEGEILGFSGLVGAGRTEMVRALFGVDPIHTGEVYLDGKKLKVKNPGQMIGEGFAMVSEDRKKYGLILNNSVAFNLTLMVAKRFIKHLHVDKNKEIDIINEYVQKLRIKLASPSQLCQNLSGGNQQKVVISKCLAAGSKILIMDEPTRGIDVGAKHEIYELIMRLARDEHLSIIMISSELSEILNLSSRIAVMHEGALVHTFDTARETVTQEMIMQYATMGGDN